MREFLFAKISQHDDVHNALRWTGSRIIIEKGNPNEECWGDGRNHTGQNVLGKLWMELRNEFFTPAELLSGTTDIPGMLIDALK